MTASLIPKWKTKDGRRIPINELEDTHLDAIVRMIRGTGGLTRDEYWRLLTTALGCMGDYAAMAVETEIESSHYSPWLDVLEKEKERRKANEN